MNSNKSGTQLDRRSFLKGVAATGVITTIATVNPISASQMTNGNTAAAKSWRDKPDPIDEKIISDGGTYDIVVVGGGNSGLFCARAASMNGASVAVIEYQAEKNYVRGIGSQCGTVNSQFALDHGALRIDEDDFLREWARRNVIRHNPKRASYFVKNSGRIFDWAISIADKEWIDQVCNVMSCPHKPNVLMEVSGWKFYYGCASFRGYKNPDMATRTEPEPWSELLRMHQENAMSDGAKWFNEHHAEICDIDDSGTVTGVVAKRADGTYVRFKARKGVALCAGGFAGNREMVLDILDSVRHEAEAMGDLDLVRAGNSMGSPRDGSGLKMGIWAGGHIEVGPRSTLGEGDPGCGVWFLQLDHNGERFCDEAAGTTLHQPLGSVRVALYDASWKTALLMMPPRHMAPDNSREEDISVRLSHLDDLKPGPLSEDRQRGRMGGGYGLPGISGSTCCANSIEELLDYMDCYHGEARKRALAEIKRYNELCEKGVDEDFGKDSRILKATALKQPLFYGTTSTYDGAGMFGLGAGMSSTTGLDTDADGHVLDANFKPIKGLYAAGNNAGGRFITVYQSPIAGISIGMAMTEGHMLGERLAEL
jgi:succinate dehydrogenase/fumarate reductase flavoprotein subunit